MKATYHWIKEYVPDFDGTVEEMCERFTMSGTEVEFWTEIDGDFVIEFSVTSNRVDCLGIVGLARELAAATGLRFRHPDCTVEASTAPIGEKASVAVEDTDGCPRYTAHVLEGVTVKPSPDWMAKRLEAIGLRPVNNIVDVTNYVLFEMNQPFHAFDLSLLPEGRIVVRRARDGEKMRAINDKEYTLDADMSVITDAGKPVAIAGVMGGLDTEVRDTTTTILLESAFFNPVRTRRTSRKLALSSDSSFRFERGIDRELVLLAARRCAKLILETGGGSLRMGVIDVNEGGRSREKIPLRYEQVERSTGIEVPWNRCREILESLECRVEGDPKRGNVRIVPPSFRGDLEREIDIVEEIIRIHGLEHLPLESVMGVRAVKTTPEASVERRLKDRLVATGFFETLTTSFVSEDEAKCCFFAETPAVTIKNAMRSDENALRQSLLPSLLRIRKNNQDLGNADIRIAECTVVYLQRDASKIPDHLPIIGGLIDGDYREARGAIESLAAALGISGLTFEALDNADNSSAFLDADGGAGVRIGDKIVGFVGRPIAQWLDRFDLKVTPYYFELRRDHLVAASDLVPTFEMPSRFPGIRRDLAIVVDDAVSWGDVENLVAGLDLPHLEEVEVFDEYRGKQIPKGKKSLAFSLSYRSHERTLTNEEVDDLQDKVVTLIGEKTGAEIRK